MKEPLLVIAGIGKVFEMEEGIKRRYSDWEKI